MPKSSPSLDTLPPAASDALRRLGENLAIARIRRKESQRAWAQRLGVSVPTLIRLERGDAAVGAGIYATALWLIGRASALAELAAPAEDRGALEGELRAAVQRRAVRSQASVQARLGRSANNANNTSRANKAKSTKTAKSIKGINKGARNSTASAAPRRRRKTA